MHEPWPYVVADVVLAATKNGIVEIAGPERAPFNKIVARYLKAVGDPRQVVRDPEARYFDGRVSHCSSSPRKAGTQGRRRVVASGFRFREGDGSI